MEFFTEAVGALSAVLFAVGAGFAVWGIINISASMGDDQNAHMRNTGVKQIMGGGGLIFLALGLVLELAGVFG